MELERVLRGVPGLKLAFQASEIHLTATRSEYTDSYLICLLYPRCLFVTTIVTTLPLERRRPPIVGAGGGGLFTRTHHHHQQPVVHHQKRHATLGDKVSGALLKLKGAITHRPGQKAAGTRRMHGTDGRGSHRTPRFSSRRKYRY
ncbi:hypothetical protein CIB48_g3037 [Xylaria polymorpha]|nr:hypothetical protein CIB48_g3037 [Xylaria polymorpha]